MAEFWTEEREDQLIDLFQEQPCLYDTNLKTYSNRINKQAALSHIGQVLGVNDKEVNKKIHSLRTQYNRYKRMAPSGSAGGKTSRQVFILRRLSFLEPHIKKRATMSNMNDKDDDDAADDAQAELEDTEDIDINIEDEDEEESSEISGVHQNPKKRKADQEQQERDVLIAVGSYLKHNSTKKNDSITVFCKNLENKIRRIKNENIRLDLEHQLEDACYRAVLRDKTIPNPTPAHSNYYPDSRSPPHHSTSPTGPQPSTPGPSYSQLQSYPYYPY